MVALAFKSGPDPALQPLVLVLHKFDKHSAPVPLDHADDALAIRQRAPEHGCTDTVGIIPDGTGRAKPLSDREREI